MNDVFARIKMHTVWHLMVLLQFISFIIWETKCTTQLLLLKGKRKLVQIEDNDIFPDHWSLEKKKQKEVMCYLFLM